MSSQENDDGDEDDDLQSARLNELIQGMPGATSSKATESGVSGGSRSKITLADLGLGGVKDPQIKKSLKLLKKEEKAAKPGKTQKLEVPLAKRQQDKLLRAAAYEKCKETLDRWTETVKRNRRADHLVFPLPQDIPSASLDNSELLQVNSKSIGSELQQTILSVLEESGLGPKPPRKAEAAEEGDGDGHQNDSASVPDLRSILAEKRIRREKESREQIRAKRIKKIKSKAYHRIHKRQRIKEQAKLQEAADDEGGSGLADDSDEEREAHDRRRAAERMGARHRESQWGKGSSKVRRAAWDDEYRMSMSEHARRTQELRQRKEDRQVGEDGSDAEEGSVESDDEDEGEESARARLRRELREVEELEDEPGSRSRLMNQGFMLRAEEAQRKLNDEAIAQIRRELDPDAEDTGSESGGGDVGWRTYGHAAGAQPKPASGSRSKKQQQLILEHATLQSVLQDSNTDVERMEKDKGAEQPNGSKWLAPRKASKQYKSNKTPGAPSEITDYEKAQALISIPASSVAANGLGSAAPSKKQAKSGPNTTTTTTTSIAASAAILLNEAGGYGSGDSDGEDGEDGPGAASSTSGSRRIRIADTRENRKLFAHAFPDQITGAEGDDHEHVEAQFTAEKAAVAAEDDDRVEDATIPGWGSWTGPGIKEGRSKRKFLKTIPGIKKKEDRRDAKLERVIINEKRIKKVSYPSSGANLC